MELTRDQMRYALSVARRAAKRGLNTKQIKAEVRLKMHEKYGEIDWDKLLAFLELVIPLILKILSMV